MSYMRVRERERERGRALQAVSSRLTKQSGNGSRSVNLGKILRNLFLGGYIHLTHVVKAENYSYSAHEV